MWEFYVNVPEEAEHTETTFYTVDASVNFHFVL